MENLEIKQLVHNMSILKEKFRYYQNCQEVAKHEYNIWDPYDGLTKDQHERKYGDEIASNRYILNSLEKKIKECRKKLKQANREQNKKREA